MNHSLRATTTTRLYDNNVDEQLICETTGHRSTAVHKYKSTSAEQKEHKSAILHGNKKSPAKHILVASVNSSTENSVGQDMPTISVSRNTGTNSAPTVNKELM